MLANIIVAAVLIAVVGMAVYYIVKEKKKGRKCIGCPYSGTAACHCSKEKKKD